MGKSKVLRVYKRALAFFMAVALMFSSFSGMSMTAYAAEDIVISDADLQETEEIIEETGDETVSLEVEEPIEEPVADEPVIEEIQEPTEEPTAEPTAEPTEEPADETTAEPTEEPVVEENSTPEVTEEPAEEGLPESTEEPALVSEEAEEISEPEIIDISPDTEEAYIGMVNGEGLYINYMDMESAGMEFSDENLIRILESHDGAAYSPIQIDFPTVAGVVDADVWNAVKAISKSDYGHFYLNFKDEEGLLNYSWIFTNLENASADVVLEADFVMSNEGEASVTFANTAIPAEVVECQKEFWESNTENASWKAAFADGCTVRVNTTDGKRAEDGDSCVVYLNNYANVTMIIENVKKLSSGEKYILTAAPEITYTGTYDSEGKSLSIEASAAKEAYGEFGDDIVFEILKHRLYNRTNEEKYQYIEIIYENAQNTIDKLVWNTAVELFTEGETELDFSFPEGMAHEKAWAFLDPTHTENDLEVSADMAINGIGGGMTISVGNTNFPASSAIFIPYASAEMTDNEPMKNAFYFMWGEDYYTMVRDAERNEVQGAASRFIVREDDSVRLLFVLFDNKDENVTPLVADTAYTVATVFGGYTWEDNGVSGLDIVLQDIGRDTITVEEIHRMMAEHGEAKFDEIMIDYPYAESITVPADVLNVLLGYLKEQHDDISQYFRIGLSDRESQVRYEFRIRNPKEQTEDKTVSAVLAMQDGAAIIRVSGASFEAEATDLYVEFGNENSNTSLLKEVYGEENIPLLIGGVETGAHYDVYDDHVSIYFDEVNGYDESVHVIGDGRYFGEVQGDRLFIDYRELENCGQDASNETFTEILKSYEGQKFTAVHLTVPAGEDDRVCVVNKNVYNEARKLLATDGEGIYYNFNHEERNVLWFISKGKALAKNQTLKYDVYINEFGKPALKLTLPKKEDMGGSGVSLAVEYLKGTGPADEMMEFMGEPFVGAPQDEVANIHHRLFPLTNDERLVKWVDNGDFLKVAFMNDMYALSNNKEYVILDKFPGGVNDEWGRELSISNYDIGKSKISASDLKEALRYYVEEVENGNMERFVRVHMEQPFVSGKNTIRKSDINYLNKLLIEEPGENGRGLGFTFCRCTYDESTDTPYTYDLIWNIDNPGTATKDIDANVVPKTNSQGVSVTFAENSFKADEVRLQVRVSRGVAIADHMVDVLGEAGEDSRELAVLKKKGLALTKLYANCWSDSDNTVYNLHISEVAKYAADTEYLIAPFVDLREDVESRLFVQDNANNLTKIKTQEKPDKDTLSWSSSNTSILRIAANGSSVEALNEGEIMYRASYKVGGKARLEVYKNFVENKLLEMYFNRDTIVMELPHNERDMAPEYYLGIKFYPANAGRDYNDLAWNFETIEGEDVVEQIMQQETVDTDEEGNPIEPVEVDRFYGGIRALNPGTVEVTVTDPVTGLSDTCTIVVEPPLTVPVGELPEKAYFIAGVDATLETAVLESPEGATGSWKFKNPSMSLAPYTNADMCLVNAIYTDEYGREVERMIDVRIISIDSLEIFGYVTDVEGNSYDDIPEMLWDTEMANLHAGINIRNGMYEELEAAIADGRIAFKWSSDPVGIGNVSEENNADYSFTADLADTKKGAGKKTITAKLVNTKTDATIAKKSHTITVVKNDIKLTNWEAVETEFKATSKAGKVGEKGTLIVRMPKENYSKLTFTSLDTGICKLGAKDKIKVDKTSDPKYVITKVPYEIKGRGDTFIKIQSSDEMKSSCNVPCGSADLTPKYAGEEILLNSKMTESVSGFSIATNCEVYLASLNPADYTLTGDGAEYFEICNIYEAGAGGTATIFDIKLIDKTAPKGTYNLKVNNVTTVWEVEGVERARETFSVKIPVKVTNATPSVKVEQTKKVNLFYTDHEANGLLTLSTGAEITDVQLIDCDYEMFIAEGNTYSLAVKEGTKGSDKKGKIIYQIPGYDSVSKNIEIETETKAPTLVLSAKTDTLYPNSDLWYTGFAAYDKKSGEGIEFSKVEWIKNAKKKQYVEIPVGGTMVENTVKKSNAYDISISGNCVDFLLRGDKLKKATDKIEFRVWEANWKSPVKVSYSISTILTTPTVELSKSTITLNVNKSVYQNQSVNVRASLKGMTRPDVPMNIWFVGKDAASRKILNNNFVLETWGANGDIWARFNARSDEDRPKTGTYKFDVKVEALDKVYTKTLTVKIIDKSVSKCLTLKKTGSIDVLDRENTSIKLTPKLSNVSGKVVYGWIEGADAELFNSYFDFESGKLVINAHRYHPLLVNYNYKVVPVFQVEGPNGERYEIKGSTQTIKLTQGKVKLALKPMKNALYRDADNTFMLNVRALSVKENPVEIRDVRLLNYTNDLDAWFDGESGTLWVSQYGRDKMWAKNKTYNLKLEVTFSEQGGNVKSQTVTYKLKLK